MSPNKNSNPPTSATTSTANHLWVAMMPGLFVLLWSTGFIGAKLGLPYAEPMTFLALRFVILTAMFGAISLVTGATWPKTWAGAGRIAIAGLLVHAVYLGGVFIAISQGVPAGVAALITGVQPLLTAVAAGPFLGERVSRRQWMGFGLGLVGVALVVSDKLSFDGAHLSGIAFAIFALFGITAGTLYQKRHGAAMDLRTGSTIQFAASGVVLVAAAFVFETMTIQWTGEFVFALSWLVVVLSVGAVSLLMLLIRQGAASKVASLFYLVPPVVAVVAYFLFDETLGAAAIFGMVATMIAVALVVRD